MRHPRPLIGKFQDMERQSQQDAEQIMAQSGMKIFQIQYSYCGDVSTCMAIAQSESIVRTEFLAEMKSGTKIIKITEQE